MVGSWRQTVGSFHVFHSAGNPGQPQASPSQPTGFWKDWEQDLGSQERQQQCPVLLWEGVCMYPSRRDS